MTEPGSATPGTVVPSGSQIVTISNTGVNYGALGVFNAPVNIYQPEAAVDWAKETAEALAVLGSAPRDRLPDPGPLPPRSRMPLRRNPLFVGRERLLLEAAGALDGRASVGATVIVAGIGGAGKTQFACELVHRYGQFFADVFWLRFADGAAVPSEFAACGSAAHLRLARNFEELAFDERVERVAQAFASPVPRLLVFDNCEDQALLDRWRPKTGGARVLVTSRRAQWDVSLGVTTLGLPELDRAESLTLLLKFRPDLSASAPGLGAIADTLGDLPLALHLAGSYLRAVRHSPLGLPASYLRQLHAATPLAHPSLQGAAAGPLPTEHEPHVATTFALSVGRLLADDATDVRAAALLQRAAWFAPGESIPRTILIASLRGEDPEAALDDETAIARLVSLGLLEEEGDGAVRLHRLVAGYVRSFMDDPAARAAVEDALVRRTNAIVRGGRISGGRALEVHLRGAANGAAPRRDLRAAYVADALGNFFRRSRAYEAAHDYLHYALDVAEETFGCDEPRTAYFLNGYGNVLRFLGRSAEAGAYLKRALALWDYVPSMSNKAATLDNLAQLMSEVGDYPAARDYYGQALDLRIRHVGEKSEDTAITLHNLGMLMLECGEKQEARRLLERSLAIREEILPDDADSTATSRWSLGVALQQLGDVPGAVAVLRRALAVEDELEAHGHRDAHRLARVLTLLMTLTTDAADLAGYAARLAPILASRDVRLSTTALSNAGIALWTVGDLVGATELYRRALQNDAVASAGRTDTGDELRVLDRVVALNNLGMALADQDDLDGADEALRSAIATHTDSGGGEAFLARLLTNHGGVLVSRGETAAARAHLERALAIRESLVGPNGADVGVTLYQIARLARTEGRTADAHTAIDRALLIHRCSGDRNRSVARDRAERGRILGVEGKLADAEAELRTAAAIQEMVLAPDHPYLADTLLSLAEVVLRRGDPGEARSLAERPARVYERRLGATHPRTVRAREAAAE